MGREVSDSKALQIRSLAIASTIRDQAFGQKSYFLISQPKHILWVLGTQKNCLNEMVLLSTQNIC